MENKQPVLSVIVITFNQLHFLKQTIDSIAQQDTQYFFEIIVSDDCSTDGTREYCESFAGNDRFNFKYARMEKNGGITANCNFGLRQIRGKYVTVIGGDDLFLPSKIQLHVAYMEAHPEITISYHPVDIFTSETDETILLTNQSRVDTPLSVLEVIKLCIPGSVSVLVRSTALPAGGFDMRLPVVSDWLYYIEVAAKGEVGFFQKTLARYRKHGNQASSKTYELLEESLRNLDLAKEKLPMLEGIEDAISIGKSRYILGEAYRQLVKGDKKLSRHLIYRAMSYKKNIAAYGLLAASYVGFSVMKGSSVRAFMKRIF
ncbi:MAG: glycosyltransferase [Pseudomonadota bacterium]|nr:glycosyltransferase [Pseudomonadota bacterium]